MEAARVRHPMRSFLRAKIHKATVTEANVDYEGSITIDEVLIQKSGLRAYEKVLVVDNTNGSRIETYVIKGKKNSGTICINGAAAHHVQRGDEVIIMAFEWTNKAPGKPKNVLVDGNNRFVKYLV
jgi:aspartate 1-decarboxylase